jgi:hypothetical protein
MSGSAGGRIGRSAVYFFCGHVFDEDVCERRPGTSEFVCATCQLNPAKQRIRRSMESGEVRPVCSSRMHVLCVELLPKYLASSTLDTELF